MKEMNAHGLYQVKDIMELTEIMENEISRGVRKNRSETETAYILTAAYASDLIHRGKAAMPLALAEDESEAMFRAAMTAYIGNLFGGQFSQAEVHEITRKMLSSYLMFWAWNTYYQMKDAEHFTMRMRLKMGNDPITQTPGLRVQEIILRDIKDPTLTYTFDAAAAAVDCVNTICPISVDTGEEDEDGGEESVGFFGAFGCSPAAFRCRIMQELYAAFPERYEAWEKANADDLNPDSDLPQAIPDAS